MAELDVQVDVAARARLARAQLVVADDAAVGEGLDLRADRLAAPRPGSASSTSTRSEPIVIRDAGDDDRHGDHERDDRVEPVRAGHADQREADEHADRRVGVGAQVRGVALQRGQDVSRARRKSQLETARLAALAKPMTTMPMPRFSSSGPWISARIAAKAITAEPARISIPSAAAAAFSNFSWP